MHGKQPASVCFRTRTTQGAFSVNFHFDLDTANSSARSAATVWSKPIPPSEAPLVFSGHLHWSGAAAERAPSPHVGSCAHELDLLDVLAVDLNTNDFLLSTHCSPSLSVSFEHRSDCRGHQWYLPQSRGASRSGPPRPPSIFLCLHATGCGRWYRGGAASPRL